MLDPHQAHIIHELASRSLTIDGEIVDVPAGFDLAEVVDAMATLEAARDDAGGRALVLEFLDRIAPDLGAAVIEADGPSKARLAKHHGAALDLLREVLDALARICDALGETACSAPELASIVERLVGEARRDRDIVSQTGYLLESIVPDYDGQLTATAVELARKDVARRLNLISAHYSASYVEKVRERLGDALGIQNPNAMNLTALAHEAAVALAKREDTVEVTEELPDGWRWSDDGSVAIGPSCEKVWIHEKGTRKPPHVEFASLMYHGPVDVVLACIARARRLHPEWFAPALVPDSPGLWRLSFLGRDVEVVEVFAGAGGVLMVRSPEPHHDLRVDELVGVEWRGRA